MTLKICNGCKKPFIPKGQERNGGNATSCSAKCAEKTYREHDYSKVCKSCGARKNIKEFGVGGGTYNKRDNCLVCSPAKDYSFGSSKKFKNKKDYVEIKEAYIPNKAELTQSVLRITDKEQIDVESKD